MFHMLATFDLRPGHDAGVFEADYVSLAGHLQSAELLEGTSPILRRRLHPHLDTDDARQHAFSVVMRFRDERQADECYARIKARAAPTGALHRRVWDHVRVPVFTCWEDDV